MEYIKLFWENAPKGEPTIILYEVDVDNQRLALRVKRNDFFPG